eukprot:comp22403_c0_seq1/m.54551 comp22403_c0_seq1/g.54551  ORF comp22403_c0_seq1/g.54551 comp22403_c0_seq1/m.54551 type:complete len:670 (-) comp22403_c0_seq1:1579-3588(-)
MPLAIRHRTPLALARARDQRQLLHRPVEPRARRPATASTIGPGRRQETLAAIAQLLRRKRRILLACARTLKQRNRLWHIPNPLADRLDKHRIDLGTRLDSSKPASSSIAASRVIRTPATGICTVGATATATAAAATADSAASSSADTARSIATATATAHHPTTAASAAAASAAVVAHHHHHPVLVVEIPHRAIALDLRLELAHLIAAHVVVAVAECKSALEVAVLGRLGIDRQIKRAQRRRPADPPMLAVARRRRSQMVQLLGLVADQIQIHIPARRRCTRERNRLFKILRHGIQHDIRRRRRPRTVAPMPVPVPVPTLVAADRRVAARRVELLARRRQRRQLHPLANRLGELLVLFALWGDPQMIVRTVLGDLKACEMRRLVWQGIEAIVLRACAHKLAHFLAALLCILAPLFLLFFGHLDHQIAHRVRILCLEQRRPHLVEMHLKHKLWIKSPDVRPARNRALPPSDAAMNVRNLARVKLGLVQVAVPGRCQTKERKLVCWRLDLLLLGRTLVLVAARLEILDRLLEILGLHTPFGLGTREQLVLPKVRNINTNVLVVLLAQIEKMAPVPICKIRLRKNQRRIIQILGPKPSRLVVGNLANVAVQRNPAVLGKPSTNNQKHVVGIHNVMSGLLIVVHLIILALFLVLLGIRLLFGRRCRLGSWRSRR